MGISVALPAESSWADITAQLGDAPLTYAKGGGVGALQFSAGIYQSGTIPRASAPVLRDMLAEFAQANHLGAASDTAHEDGPLFLSAGSFRTDAFFRVWYVSDGSSFALATYTCALENEAIGEVAECEQIVRSVRLG
jgi:hypothetical protein